MTTSKKQGSPEIWLASLAALLFIITLAMLVSGVPQGANIVSNFTEGTPASPPGSRADDGGTITVLGLNSTQQNQGWKAYVGNVSGRLTLDDSSGNTIYDWTIAASSIQGEVYVSRNDSVDWNSVSCANQTIVDAEQAFLNINSSESDSINTTFDSTTHASMQVGTSSITNSTCRSTATYVNDTSQTINESTPFQEILLQDGNDNLVYATFIDQDSLGYKTDNTTYDFQVIIAEDSDSGTPTTYYFYMEIS